MIAFKWILNVLSTQSRALHPSRTHRSTVRTPCPHSVAFPLPFATLSTLKGLSVAQVRVIFQLPLEYGRFDTPLAYVEWYTPLTSYIPAIGMYQISRSFRNRYRRASIIPVNQIVRSCHLIPKFGTKIGRSWNAENVLALADHYYVNCDISLHNFVLFRYLDPSSDES